MQHNLQVSIQEIKYTSAGKCRLQIIERPERSTNSRKIMSESVVHHQAMCHHQHHPTSSSLLPVTHTSNLGQHCQHAGVFREMDFTQMRSHLVIFQKNILSSTVEDRICLMKSLSKASFLRCGGDRKEDSPPGRGCFLLLDRENYKP